MEEHTAVHSPKTQLKDRVLWFDGDSAYKASDVTKLITKYNIEYVDTLLNPLVQQYNKNVPKAEELRVKIDCNPINLDWNIPEQYKNLDLFEYVIQKHIQITSSINTDDALLRDMRILQELDLYSKHGLTEMLKAIIYVIETLDVNNVVRGVGRGSSVASYILYVIGVHDVDSYAYGLEISEFLRD